MCLLPDKPHTEHQGSASGSGCQTQRLLQGSPHSRAAPEGDGSDCWLSEQTEALLARGVSEDKQQTVQSNSLLLENPTERWAVHTPKGRQARGQEAPGRRLTL